MCPYLAYKEYAGQSTARWSWQALRMAQLSVRQVQARLTRTNN